MRPETWPDFEGRCGEVLGGAHLPWDRFAPPLRIFAPHLKSRAPPLGKISMIDQVNIWLFWLLRVYTPWESFFCKIEAVIAFHLCVKYPSWCNVLKEMNSNCNEWQNWMSCAVIISLLNVFHLLGLFPPKSCLARKLRIERNLTTWGRLFKGGLKFNPLF